MNNVVRICPKCGRKYTDFPAISRLDNETEICPECGTDEALDAWAMYRAERNREAGLDKLWR